MTTVIKTRGIHKITFDSDALVNFILRGAGGGGGGNDAGSSGGSGGSGNYLNVQIPVVSGDVYYAVIGAPGRGGPGDSDYYGDIGGAGGKGAFGYNGGTGGIAGYFGSSGNGGGGGSISGLFKVMNDTLTPVAIAGGGGGGAGAGLYSAGTSNPNRPTKERLGDSLKYYAAGSHPAWGSFMNNYAVYGSTNSTFRYEVFFPASGNYTFTMAADDVGGILLDGAEIYTLNDYNAFRSSFSVVRNVTAGWHEVGVYYNDIGGPPYGAALTVTNSSGTIIHHSRDAYNKRTVSLAPVVIEGGEGERHGGDGGAGGGGGAGYPAGAGGLSGSGDNGGNFGSSGFNYVNTSIATDLGTSFSSFPGSENEVIGLGVGGGPATGSGSNGDGTSGYIMLESAQRDIRIYNNPNSALERALTSVNPNFPWRTTVNDVYLRRNNQWERVKEVFVRNNNEWVRVHGIIENAIVTQSQSQFFYDTTLPANQISNLITQQAPVFKNGASGIWNQNTHTPRFLRSYLAELDEGQLTISVACDDHGYVYVNGKEVINISIFGGVQTITVPVIGGSNVITIFGVNGPGPGSLFCKITYEQTGIGSSSVINLEQLPSSRYRAAHDVFVSGAIPLVGKTIRIPDVGVVTVTGFSSFQNTNGYRINTTNGSYLYYDYAYIYDGHVHPGVGTFSTPELLTEIDAGRVRLFDTSPFSDVPQTIPNGSRTNIGRQGYLFINPSFDPFPTITF